VVGVAVTRAISRVVDASEEQRLVADRQLIEPRECRGHHDVAFDQVAGTAHVGDRGTVAKRTRLVAHVVKGA